MTEDQNGTGTTTRTWHYGLIARYWDEFNHAEPAELAYYRAAIARFGEPVLDVGCGTGRLLLALAAAGIDVDGADVSGDMIALCAQRAAGQDLHPRLFVQSVQELDVGRIYRTAYLAGVFGIGGSRDDDLEGLRRLHRVLEPGGALLIDHELPYATEDEEAWLRWLPKYRSELPTHGSATGERRRAANGDEFELFRGLMDFDPLRQQMSMELGARLWRDGQVIEEQPPRMLRENLYFAQELLLALRFVGFGECRIERAFTGELATAQDGKVVLVARKPE